MTGIGLLAALAALTASAEPSLQEAQAAAARLAAGEASEDASRTARLRRSRWAPVVRGQVGGRADDRTRIGELRGYPLRQDDAGTARIWSITATWDLGQLIYAHQESQLALAHVHLARVRREASDRAAALWVERKHKRAALRAGSGEARREAALELLRVTAELDAVTGGLYRDLLAQEEAAVSAEEP